MDFLTLISNKDILYEICKEIYFDDSATLIRLCKKSRYIIGMSNIWINPQLVDSQVTKIISTFKYFVNNSLCKEFVIRDYYSDAYYVSMIVCLFYEPYRWNLLTLLKEIKDFRRIAKAIDIITGNTGLQSYRSVVQCITLLNELQIPIDEKLCRVLSSLYPSFIRIDWYSYEAEIHNHLYYEYNATIDGIEKEMYMPFSICEEDHDQISVNFSFLAYKGDFLLELIDYINFEGIDLVILVDAIRTYLLGINAWDFTKIQEFRKGLVY